MREGRGKGRKKERKKKERKKKRKKSCCVTSAAMGWLSCTPLKTTRTDLGCQPGRVVNGDTRVLYGTVLVCVTLYNTCSRFSKGCERTR